MSATPLSQNSGDGRVTARFQDGTAGIYNSVEEALDQASYDEEMGYRFLQDVIDGAYDGGHLNVPDLVVVADRAKLNNHHLEWSKKWSQVAGRVMPREDAEKLNSVRERDILAEADRLRAERQVP